MYLIPLSWRESLRTRLRPASLCVATVVLAASVAIVVFQNDVQDRSATRELHVESHNNEGSSPEDATYLMQSMTLHVQNKFESEAVDLRNASTSPTAMDSTTMALDMSMIFGLLGSLGGLGGLGNSTAPLLGALAGSLGDLSKSKTPSLLQPELEHHTWLELHTTSSSFLRIIVVACIIALACACFFVLVPFAAKDMLRRPSEIATNTVNSALTASRMSPNRPHRDSARYAVISNSSSSPASSPEATPFTQDLSGTLPSLSPPIPHIRVSMFGGIPQYGSRLGIPVSDMARVSTHNQGDLCVVADFAASPIMWINVNKSPGSRSIKVYVDRDRRTPVVELKPDSTGFMGGNSALEIFGGGFFYGHLETDSNRNYVTHAGVKELTIEGETDPFEIKVTKTRSGKQVAAVRKNDDFMGTEPYIEFGILKPAEEDTVLVLSCVLAVMFLQRTVLAV